jgi:iron-sulfur cluster repair protein YtfE (RIC family)
MNAIKFLKQQHGQAKAGFEKVEAAAENQRRSHWQKLRPELELHETIEETCLYGPVASEPQVDKSLANWEEIHQKEVREAEGLIKSIDRLDPATDEWLQTVKKLHGALEQHIRKEEGDIWPKIERVWNSARLEEAGRQMEAMKSAKSA